MPRIYPPLAQEAAFVETVSGGVTIVHDGSGTPTGSISGNTVSVTANSTNIYSLKFQVDADGSGNINVTHEQDTKTVAPCVVYADVRINNANYSLTLPHASSDPTNRLVITGAVASDTNDVMLIFN